MRSLDGAFFINSHQGGSHEQEEGKRRAGFKFSTDFRAKFPYNSPTPVFAERTLKN